MMEMRMESRPMNIYDNPEEQTKTEDMNESLQTSPTRATRKASGKKIMVTLLIINILLLTTILLVVGLHYHQFRQSGKEMLNGQKPSQEMWYLHNDSFYLFWSNHSDCETAYKFCKERMANLTSVTNNNKDWLKSQINGKRLLVKRDWQQSQINGSQAVVEEDGSADFERRMMYWVRTDISDSDLDVEEDGPDDLDEHVKEEEIVQSACMIFGETSNVTEQVEVEGWVCERQTISIRPS